MSKSAYDVPAVKDEPSAEEIFYQIEAECPEDTSNLMIGGRRITPHGNWHDENGW